MIRHRVEMTPAPVESIHCLDMKVGQIGTVVNNMDGRNGRHLMRTYCSFVFLDKPCSTFSVKYDTRFDPKVPNQYPGIEVILHEPGDKIFITVGEPS